MFIETGLLAFQEPSLLSKFVYQKTTMTFKIYRSNWAIPSKLVSIVHSYLTFF